MKSVGAGEGHHTYGLRQVRQVREQHRGCLALLAALADREDRLHRAADRRRIDLGVKSGHHPAGLQLAHPLQAGGRSDPDVARHGLVGLPSILLEFQQERPVDRIEFDGNTDRPLHIR